MMGSGKEREYASLKNFPNLNPESRPLPTFLSRLGDAEPGHFVNFKARVVSFSFREIEDEMGPKTIMKGYVEDRSFRLMLIAHRLFDEFERDQVYLFKNVLIHEFEEGPLSLVVTQYSRIEKRSEENVSAYYWKPTIGDIKRPVWNLYLSGTVTRIFSSSGLVRRCDKCHRVLTNGQSCPAGCREGWSWDLRVSFQLSDRTGSIRTILGRHSAARLLARSISEILYVANSSNSMLEPRSDSGFSYKIELPHEIEVTEGVVKNQSSLRSRANPLVIMEGFGLAYSPRGVPIKGPASSDQNVRKLEWETDPRDARVLRKLLERVIDAEIQDITKCPALNGLYLLDSPLNMYNTEKAKLYSGFTTKLRLSEDKHVVILDFFPEARILESVYEFVKWKRARGATANSIENYLLERRANNVSVAPLGKLGAIKEVVWTKAGETKSSPNDT